MLKEEVIKFRDEACKGSLSIIVTCDNMIVYSTATEFLIWDDDNEHLYAIRANTDHYNQDKAPIEISCTKYDNIQYIEGNISAANLKTVLDDFFVANNLITEEQKTKVIAFADDISNHLL